MSRWLSLRLLVPFLPFALLGACKRATSEVAQGEASFELPVRPPTASVQVGAFTDEARAQALRDSLALDGWTSWLAKGTLTTKGKQSSGWRVHVLPTASERLPALAVAAFKKAGRDAVVSREAPPEEMKDVGVELWPVIAKGSHGMAARTRWVLSPDTRAMLVMEDPTAVEAEPLPNGVLLASEATAGVLQLDDLWDAAPSPDWQMLGVGRAFILRGGGGPITPSQWRDLARRLPPEIAKDIAPGERTPAWEGWVEAQLRAHAFPVSGMGIASGVGIAQVIPVDSLLGVDPARRVPLATPRALRFDGWQIRWGRTADTVAVGVAPRFPRDGAPSPRWYLERPTAPGAYGERQDSTGLAPVPWVQGPVLDAGRPVDLQRDTVLETRRVRIESKGGWIHVSRRGGRGEGEEARIIGPGVPLATTAGGRFIVALVPRPEAKPGEAAASLVVYRVAP